MRSKKLEEDGNIGKAACLARNSHIKNMTLEMSPNKVVYEQNPSILTSEGLYDTIKVVKVTKGTEVTCTSKFNSSIFSDYTLSGEEDEETVPGTVCNTTDTSAQDTKMEKANMLSMAVLGLRVLLAKTVAFNTLMSIKLFLF
ncbi:TRDC protein, partial [Chloroceryle aenea]|nr:TRDC protein [Chloroceryle aenea]